LHDAKRYKEAIDAYDSVLGLTGDLASLNSEVFRRMSLSYVALGDYCEAMTPIQTLVSIDPSKNDTPAAHAMIKDYSNKGKCEESYATGKDRFPTQGKDVITATVSVNGVSGVFIVDTGASVVSLTQRFAELAKLQLSGDLSVRMQSANGVSLAQRSSAKQIRIGHVEAKDVATIVLTDGNKPLGDGIDGLLGRSFLSRFDVTFGAREWRIESK
jgi:clan AA aspartic protease (TIGR02281 family)